MRISDLITGNFVDRPNRFTVQFNINGKTEKAHLRDPGRLKELLTPEVPLLLKAAQNTVKRKTKFDVIAVFNEDRWVLINSGFHSDIAAELIGSGVVDEFKGYAVERREYTYGKSRLDFLLSNQNNLSHTSSNKNLSSHKSDKRMLLEVKGCTLVENGMALFPDAPTVRGKKHVEELIRGKSEGFNAAVLFLIMRDDAMEFSPNWKMDPDFSRALLDAQEKDVNVIAHSFKNILTKDILEIKPFKRVKISFNQI